MLYPGNRTKLRAHIRNHTEEIGDGLMDQICDRHSYIATTRQLEVSP